MRIEKDNENKIISELKYWHYLIKHDFPRKLMMFFRRIRINGFDRRFLLRSILSNLVVWIMTLEFSQILTLIVSLPFSINFGLMPMSEYHEKYCTNVAWLLKHHLVSVCHGTTKR